MQIAIELFLHFFRIFHSFCPFVILFKHFRSTISGIFIIAGKHFFHHLKAADELPAAGPEQLISSCPFAEAGQIDRRKHKIAQLFINGIIITEEKPTTMAWA